jgi:hypothetical protein
MITRAFVHVGGPTEAGKTRFVEAVLGEIDFMTLVARCRRDDTPKRPRESAPKGHPELLRYRQAGASGVAFYRFAGDRYSHDDFFMTDLMGDYSESVVLEGDNPLEFVDLSVFVAPAPLAGEQLFVRSERREPDRTALLEQVLGGPESVVELLEKLGGPPLAEIARRSPALLERVRGQLLDEARASSGRPVAERKRRWAVADRYAGIEHAQMVVVNVRRDAEQEEADRLAADMRRLRQDKELLADVLGPAGRRVPITVVVADISDPGDAGRKKALARVRRAVRSAQS